MLLVCLCGNTLKSEVTGGCGLVMSPADGLSVLHVTMHGSGQPVSNDNGKTMMAVFSSYDRVFLLLVIFGTVIRLYFMDRSTKLLALAHQESETLLSNILPFETANELKKFGSVKAKRFDEVTVMFTDFKEFTKLSEQMSAEDLVNMIDFYFREFDRIISRHHIEKIKIIGDGYMCASGLPFVNETHALDMVRAALEIQAFASAQKSERINRGEQYFELRIGIHTGDVVAGIVGTARFAYDIWGDTVNTVSRMESAGEAGMVNISSSTFALIKDQFCFDYRGKVSAKNKGKIDMYFVQAPEKAQCLPV